MKKFRNRHEKTINLTFFTKEFYKEVVKLNFTKKEQKLFLKEMCCLTPEERDCLIEKITRFID